MQVLQAQALDSVDSKTYYLVMGERKKHVIERLQGEVAKYQDRETALGPYVTIAQELHSRVMSRVQDMDESDLERALVEEVAEAEENLVRTGIKARVDKLPIRTVLEWYARAFGDQEVVELLIQRAEMAKEFLRDNMHVERMRQRGIIYGSVDISKTMPDDVMGVVFTHPRSENVLSGLQFRKLKQNNRAGQLFELIGVTYADSSSVYYNLGRRDVHSVMALGGALIPKSVASGGSLDPVLFRGTTLRYWEFDSLDGNQAYDIDEASGLIDSIAVNGITVLGGDLDNSGSNL